MMKYTKRILLLTCMMTGNITHASWIAANLSFELGEASWMATSEGAGLLEAGDFRTAADPDNWYPDATVGSNILILESDASVDDRGRFTQLLGGTVEAGTYTWNLADVGVTNFADGNGAVIDYGFSTDGIDFIGGASQSLTEGIELFSPDQNATGQFFGSVDYTSDGTEGALFLMFRTHSTAISGRTTVSVPSTTLNFSAVPEPYSLALMVFGGLALMIARRHT